MIRKAATFVLIISLIFAVVSCSKSSTSSQDTGPSTVAIVTPWDETTRNGVVDVLVTADDADGIDRVEFFENVTLKGTDTDEPYEFKWVMGDDPSTSIYATAIDGYGNKTSSAVVTVKKGENAAPVAKITSPVAGTSILQDQKITFSGTATDKENGDLGAGDISWSSDLQGTLPTNDNGDFTGLVIGDHIITMTATDKDGVMGTATVNVTVKENESKNIAYIPKGTYYIGQPNFKKSAVTLIHSFWMSKTEMTIKEWVQAQYLVPGMGDKLITGFITKRNNLLNGSKGDGLYPPIFASSPAIDIKKPNYDNLTYKDYPVCFVSYKEVVAVCNALSARDGGLSPAYTIESTGSITFNKGANGWRLPTEAEWEVAARGGLIGKKFPWGDGSPRGLCNSMTEQTLKNPLPFFNGRGPVLAKMYPPNAYGLYDITGNIAELCSDMFVGTVPSGVDPAGITQEKSPRYLAKGGAWLGYADDMQICGHTMTMPYNDKDKDGYNLGIGLRLVRNVE